MLSAEIILYAIRTENMLLTERISEEVFFGINAGKVEQKGLEVSLHLDPFKQKENRSFRPSLRSSFSTSENLFVDFVDKGIDYAGNSLPGIPRFSWQNECLLLFGERASIQVEHSLYGSQFLRDDNLLSYDGHQLFNLHSDIKMISHKHYDLHLKASVYNVFNEAHASMILVNAPSFGNNAPRYYYPGRPRSWQIGFLMKRKK
jgi:iron complex outermembrane receptor protein